MLTTVTNALFWVEIFVYFDEDEDRKEAMPTECNIVLDGGADYDGGSGASTIDMVVATSPPPSWLPDWFLDRTNRPSHEAPLGPNAHHQSICFSLGLIDILILALKMGRSLIKTTDSNQPGASNAMAVLVDVRVRVKRLVDAVVYCLLSLIDGHTLAKTSVLERIEDIIDCIEVTSPKNLVTLCQSIFEDETDLCKSADRALIRLICSYAHQGARELCEGGEHVRADADSFLCATLQLLRTIAGGDERQPHPAVQSCIEDALFENQDLGAIERFRRIATASSTSPAKAAQASAKAGASIASQDTRVALIQLLETVARDRAALSIRNVLPIPFLAKELITLDAHKTELSIRVQTILGNLLYHVFFATGEPELVLFTETLRSLLLNDEPPEAEGLQRLQASLLVLKTFAEAVTAQEKARRDEAGRGRLKEELEEQKKRIGLVSITAYKALAHWTKRSDRPREEARLLRSSIGLAGRAARMLAPDELLVLGVVDLVRVRDAVAEVRADGVDRAAELGLDGLEGAAHLDLEGDAVLLGHGAGQRDAAEVPAHADAHGELLGEAELLEVEDAALADARRVPVVDVLLAVLRVVLVVVADDLLEERRERRVVRGSHRVAAHAAVRVVDARADAPVERLLVLVAQAVVEVGVEVPGAAGMISSLPLLGGIYGRLGAGRRPRASCSGSRAGRRRPSRRRTLTHPCWGTASCRFRWSERRSARSFSGSGGCLASALGRNKKIARPK